jgi:hypothetical protein
VLIAWLVLNITIRRVGIDPRLIVALALLSQAIIVVLLALALRQRQESFQESTVMQPVGSPS